MTCFQAMTTILPMPPWSTPLWLIIVCSVLAILVGILCLTAITYGLTRVGFFKRNRVDPQIYRQVKKQADIVRASLYVPHRASTRRMSMALPKRFSYNVAKMQELEKQRE